MYNTFTTRKQMVKIQRHTIKKKSNLLPFFILDKIKDDKYFHLLSFNENAIKYITRPENYHRINWSFLSSNPNAIHMLKANKSKIDWNSASSNTSKDILPLLEERIKNTDQNNYKNNVNWSRILSLQLDVSTLVKLEFQKIRSKNRILRTVDYQGLLSMGNHIDILNKNKRLIHWMVLSRNKYAINIINVELKKKKNKIDWTNLCLNENAIDILKEEVKNEPNRINWANLCLNKNAIDILKEEAKNEPNRINWIQLCSNENAIDILKEEAKNQPNRIEWESICYNKNATKIILDEYKRKGNTIHVIDMFAGNDNLFPVIKPILLKNQEYLDLASLELSDHKNMPIFEFIIKMFPKLYYPTVQKDDFVSIHDVMNCEMLWNNIIRNPLLFKLLS